MPNKDRVLCLLQILRKETEVPVSLNTKFYAWVFQFVGKMNIVAPEHVREAYAGYLQEAIDEVLGG